MHAAPKQTPAPLGWMPLAEMGEWAGNPKKHPAENVSMIAASLKRYGFGSPIVLWGSERRIVAGHGRYRAALLRMKGDPGLYLDKDAPGPGMVPVRVMEFSSESEAAAYALTDNRSTEVNPMQALDVAEVLRQIQEDGGDLSIPGWTDAEIAAMLGTVADDAPGEGESKYTSKITAPIYEPKGDRPPVADLYDAAKSADLRREIDAANLPPDVASFLRVAADRHTSFHFKRIAEFYAHASPEVQRLMERSALVIIDLDSAIENGFVRLSERLAELAGLEDDSDEG